jgi:hypothetical protein
VYRRLGGTKGTVRAGDCVFIYGNSSKNYQLGTGFFVHHGTVSAVKEIEFVGNRIYIV